ncbi:MULTISPECIES: Cna B-type domain-containing protein, partial [unclassified Clostridium]
GTYNVSEEQTGTAVANYGLAVSGEGNVTVTKDATATATVTNTYTQDKGSLTVAKAVVGYDFGAAGKNFTIYVTNASGEYVLADGSISATKTGISVPANGNVTINDIPVGTYNVSEEQTGTAVANYGLAVSGEGNVTVTKDATATATVTNTYTQDKGSLTVAKAVAGYTFDSSKTFMIYVTNASGEYVKEDGSITATKTGISVPANGSVTINDIPVGTYNVSEAPTGTAITNYDLTVSGEGDVNVTKDTVVNATVTNTYTYLTTSVTVKKAWNDNNNKANKRPGFVTVQLYAGTTISGIPVQLDESNGWTKTWDNLPKYDANGLIQYTVKEVNVPKEYTDSITTDPATGEITITNTRTSTRGKLVLTKTVVGDVDKAEAENVIKFKITDEAGNSETYALTDFQYDVSTKKYTLELDKPAGTYTIEEIQYDIDGYETSSIKYVVGTGLQKMVSQQKQQ